MYSTYVAMDIFWDLHEPKRNRKFFFQNKRKQKRKIKAWMNDYLEYFVRDLSRLGKLFFFPCATVSSLVIVSSRSTCYLLRLGLRLGLRLRLRRCCHIRRLSVEDDFGLFEVAAGVWQD